MKKALIVSNSSGLITLFLKNDVEILKSKGYLVECACNTNFPDNNTEDFFREYNITFFHIEFPIRNLCIKQLVKSYLKLKKIITNGKYDLIHVHSTIAAVLARECAKDIRKRGTKIAYTSHGFPFYEGNDGKKTKIFYQIERHYSKYTDMILTICKEDFKNAKNMNCKYVYMMHGVGVDIDRFVNTHIDRAAYREKLGFLSSDKVVLSIGELNTNKNHQIVIRALAELKDKDMIYAICGREVIEKGIMQELQSLADSLNVRLRFLGFRKDIPEICHSVEIGALPSYKEGLGLSGIEMLACGIPVVGSNRQGIKDYIKNDVTGYLADPTDARSFAEAIKKTFYLVEKETTVQNCISMARYFDVRQAHNTILKAYDAIGV